MALATQPSFVGQITITTGTNDKVYWRENTGSLDLSTTLTAGDYWPDTLASHIGAVMTTESGSSGNSATFTGSFSEETGLYTFSSDGETFYLKNQATDTDSVFTGGHVDTKDGDTLLTGQWGQNGLGWLIESSYPAAAATVSSTQRSQHFWTPEYPPSQDDDGLDFESTAVQAFAIDGTPVTYDFTGWDDSDNEHPTFGTLSRRRRLGLSFETTANKALWIHQFWGPYGKQGKTFRYYPDRTASSYELHVLTGESIRSHGLTERVSGYPWWNGSIEMHRVAS